MAKYTVVISANSEFCQSIEEVAEALRAEVKSKGRLVIDEKNVDKSQLNYVLPIYGWELVEIEPTLSEQVSSIANDFTAEVVMGVGGIFALIVLSYVGGTFLHSRNAERCEQQAARLGINTSDPNFAFETMCDWGLYQNNINLEYNNRFNK